MPRFISPSALATWEWNQEEYYLKYLAENPPPRIPQTEAMSVGSSFDAYVKSYLFDKLFGINKDPAFEFQNIFETQVEEQNRDFALQAGAAVFEVYKTCGALADLFVELEKASGEPRFEFTVEGCVCSTCKTICDNDIHDRIPLLGKPDVWYINKDGLPIILDFKVNGYCSSYRQSPARGYLRLRPGDKRHKDCQPMKIHGITINIGEFFESINKSWSQQLSTYAWLCGAQVGSTFVVAIDQAVCNLPDIKFAEHRCQIGEQFQEEVYKKYVELWNIIHSDHIFRDRTPEESFKRCEMLDMQYAAYTDGEDFIKKLVGR